jgi:hypothetical protein
MSKARKGAHPRRRRRVKVFISHATVDRRRATRLGTLLAKNGIAYWYSREHLVHGQSWYRDIGAALESCNWLIVIASHAGVRNRWVREEVTHALIERRYRNRVIPLLFEDCNLRSLAWSIQSIQYIDFRSGWQRGIDRLLKRLRQPPYRRRR